MSVCRNEVLIMTKYEQFKVLMARKNELVLNIESCEMAEEKARQVDNDEAVDKAVFMADGYREELREVNRELDKLDF